MAYRRPWVRIPSATFAKLKKMFRKIVSRRLNRIIRNSKKLELSSDSKIFIFSDCHRGDGKRSDDFFHNREIFLEAIKFYMNHNYICIEIGDGDELWENPEFNTIENRYPDIFDIYKSLNNEGRLFILWGNHNRRWKSQRLVKKQYDLFAKPSSKIRLDVSDKCRIHEAVLLSRKKESAKNILLIHGHQGEFLNDYLWWFGRFFVRTFWKFFQLRFGMPDPTSPAKNYRIRNKVDKRFTRAAEENDIVIIAGHTHFPIFPKNDEPSYFNDGSCIHPRCITGIEIVNGKISLIKWYRKSISKGDIKILRKILEGPSELKIS